MRSFRLTKHEGLGNDFLVVLDPDREVHIPSELVRRLCDRRRGIGADGLLRAAAPPRAGDAPAGAVHAVMDLYNADGRRAEMSGNGIRCLAQALLLDKWVQGGEVVVSTDAGVRTVEVVEGPSPGPEGGAVHVLAVDMGPVRTSGQAAAWSGAEPGLGRATWADAGNPHLVIETDGAADVASTDLEALGRAADAATPDGANVHLVAPGPGPAEITVRTYERGVGLTRACGTGACAAAVVARGRGLLTDPAAREVTVTMPGGAAQVRLPATPGGGGGADDVDGGRVVLVAPVTSVAAVEYPWP